MSAIATVKETAIPTSHEANPGDECVTIFPIALMPGRTNLIIERLFYPGGWLPVRSSEGFPHGDKVSVVVIRYSMIVKGNVLDD
mgnify:CR=1 FL=1